MTSLFYFSIATAVFSATTWFILWRLGTRAPALYVMLFYLYLSIGPLIAYSLSGDIYAGTLIDYIPQALTIFALGQVGLISGALVIGTRTDFDLSTWREDANKQTLLPWIMAIFMVVGVLLLVRLGPGVFNSNKVQKIAAVGASLHYTYMLIEMFIVCMFFVARQNPRTYKIYLFNIIVYVAYSLVLSERDFALLFGTIVVLKIMLNEIKISLRLIVMTLVALYGATFLFAMRGAVDPVGLNSILSQGSLLFINTNIAYLSPNIFPHLGGSSYWSAVISLFPSELSGSRENLLDWFKNWYAPKGDSGYGFGLDAEAYFNFGYAGVFVVFFLLSAFQSFLVRRIDKNPFVAYFSLYFTATLFYSLRNDSWLLIHGCVYAAFFFAVAQTSLKRNWGISDEAFGHAGTDIF